MSRENAEVTRKWVEAYNAGDVEQMLDMLHPNFEYVSSGTVAGTQSVYRGHDGWRDFWRDWGEMWQALRIDIAEQRDLGDKVLVLYSFDARARAGLEVHRQFGTVTTMRDGLIARMQSYGDWTTTLEAVGLRE